MSPIINIYIMYLHCLVFHSYGKLNFYEQCKYTYNDVNTDKIIANCICITDLFELFSVPTNGLLIFCGTITTEEGKDKKVNIDFEPFKPVNKFIYMCDNRFHTEVPICLYI